MGNKNYGTTNRLCEYCNKGFYRPPSIKGRFCSRECQSNSMKSSLCSSCKDREKYQYKRKDGRIIHHTLCNECKNKYQKSVTLRIKKIDKLSWKARILSTSFRQHNQKIPIEEIKEKIKNFKICPYCQKEVKIEYISLDRIIPAFRGGSNFMDNLQFTCKDCNMMKGSLTDSEFKSLLNLTGIDTDFFKIMKSRLKASGGFIYRR
jgi:5-methylcytosine-specific restriction endonuclease McrA